MSEIRYTGDIGGAKGSGMSYYKITVDGVFDPQKSIGDQGSFMNGFNSADALVAPYRQAGNVIYINGTIVYGNGAPPPTNSGNCAGLFSEIVKCSVEGNYQIAWGWTQSTGQSGSFKYTLPTGWEYDPRYPDENGGTGTHNGCSGCIMTLVHLRKILTPVTPPVTTTPCPEGTTRIVKCPRTQQMITQQCISGVWVTIKADEKKCAGDDTAKMIVAAVILVMVIYFWMRK